MCLVVDKLGPAVGVLMHSKQSNRRIGNTILGIPSQPQNSVEMERTKPNSFDRNYTQNGGLIYRGNHRWHAVSCPV
jgi:hypothetical protein